MSGCMDGGDDKYYLFDHAFILSATAVRGI